MITNHVYFERSYPYVLGVSLGVSAWYFGALPSADRFDSMLTASISVSSILLGFLGTAKAILMSTQTARLAWIKQREAVWKLLLGYFKSALLASFIACLISLAFLGISVDQLPKSVHPFLTPIWICVFAVSVSTFYRVVSVFFALLLQTK